MNVPDNRLAPLEVRPDGVDHHLCLLNDFIDFVHLRYIDRKDLHGSREF